MSMEKRLWVSLESVESYRSAKKPVQAKKLPQYIAGLSSTIGALAAGMVLGWSSPAGADGQRLSKVYPNVAITPEQFSWIGSLATLGAGVMCIPIGVLTDLIGRKNAMLLMVVPFTVGWVCIIFSNSVGLFCAGRFITGLSGGAFCVTVPMYTSEIAQSEIRGRLGSYFELFLTSGILCAYILGKYVNMITLSAISALVPIVFFVVFSFMPETPVYFLMMGNEDAARSSLIRLRGSEYDVDAELREHMKILRENKGREVSFAKAIRSEAAVRGLIIAYGLMFFQQLSGINAVVFYTADIFIKASGELDPNDSTIIVGAMQVMAVFISTLIVDRVGRRILLLISNVSMFLSTLVLGTYFYLVDEGHDLKSLSWLPLLSICVFITLLELGFGPIPWMMMGEIFAIEIKSIAASGACLFNWLMAFIVTKFYNEMNDVFGIDGTFWIFSTICAFGIFFVFFFVPETRGRSLEEIQKELREKKFCSR